MSTYARFYTISENGLILFQNVTIQATFAYKNSKNFDDNTMNKKKNSMHKIKKYT